MATQPAATIAGRGTVLNGVMATSPVLLSRRPCHGDFCQGDGPGESTLQDGRAGSLIAGWGFTFFPYEKDLAREKCRHREFGHDVLEAGEGN